MDEVIALYPLLHFALVSLIWKRASRLQGREEGSYDLPASATFLCLCGGALCLPLPNASHEALHGPVSWQPTRPSCLTFPWRGRKENRKMSLPYVCMSHSPLIPRNSCCARGTIRWSSCNRLLSSDFATARNPDYYLRQFSFGS